MIAVGSRHGTCRLPTGPFHFDRGFARSAEMSGAIMAAGGVRQIDMRRGAETSDHQAPSVARNDHLNGAPRDKGPRHFLGLFKSWEENAEDLAIDP